MANGKIQVYGSQVGPSTIRLRFSKPVPYMTSDTGLDKSHYSIYFGGYEVPIVRVSTVPDQYDCLDLFLASSLLHGDYIVTVSGLTNSLNWPLDSSANQLVLSCQETNALSIPLKQDSAEDRLMKYKNPSLDGPNFRALMTSLATGEVANKKNAQLAFNQLFMSKASGKYLDAITANFGISRPIDGIVDELYRTFAINMYNNKVTEHAIYSTMRAFLGIDGVCAFSESTNTYFATVDPIQPIVFVLDGTKEVEIAFVDSDFADPRNPTMDECCILISKKLDVLGINAFSLIVNDRLRIYSNTMGLRSSVEFKQSNWMGFPVEKKTLYDNGINSVGYVGKDGNGMMNIYLPAISNFIVRGTQNGSYAETAVVVDNDNVFYLSNITTTTAQSLSAVSYSSFVVYDVSSFVSSDVLYVVLGFGQTNQSGPIPIKSVDVNTNTVYLQDPYSFAYPIPAGTSVTLTTRDVVLNPNNPQADNTTGNLSQGTVLAIETIQKILSCGEKYTLYINYPSQDGLSNVAQVYSGDGTQLENVYLGGR
jgi:hypothetical protein